MTKSYLDAHLDGVGQTLGRAFPDDRQDPLEVGLVQLLLQHDQVLVEVADQGLGVAAWKSKQKQS